MLFLAYRAIENKFYQECWYTSGNSAPWEMFIEISWHVLVGIKLFKDVISFTFGRFQTSDIFEDKRNSDHHLLCMNINS